MSEDNQSDDHIEKQFISLLSEGSRNILFGKIDEARELLEEARNIKNDDHRVYTALSTLHKKRNDQSSAIRVLKEGIRISPHHELFTALAEIYESKGDFNQALNNLNKSVSLSESTDAYRSIFRISLVLDDTPGCINALRSIIKLDPKDATAYRNLGGIHFELGNNKTAVVYLSKSLEIEKHPLTYEKLGYAHAKIGEFHDAIASLNRSIDSGHPDKATVNYNVNKLRKELGL